MLPRDMPGTTLARWLGPAAGASALLTLPPILGYGPIDDAYISLRYADNLAHGHGLVWNLGERVEGFSNPLWTLLLALAIGLGLHGPGAAVGLGLLLSALAIGLAGLATAHVIPPARETALGTGSPGSLPPCEYPMLAAAVAVSAGLSAPLLCYGASGLETGLHAALWLGALAGTLAYLRRGTLRPLRGAAWALGLLCLTRPEAPALVAAHALGILWLGPGPLKRRWRDALLLVAPAVALTVAWLAFRLAYYGLWLPNTYFAKVGTPSGQLAHTGLTYVGRFWLYSGGGLALAVVLGARTLRADPGIRYLLLVLGAHSALVALEGGDHMAQYRFFAPATPLFVLLVAAAARHLGAGLAGALGGNGADRAGRASKGMLIPALCLGASLVGSLALAHSPHPQASPGAPVATAHERAQVEVLLARHWVAFGRWLREHGASDDAVAALPIGAIGYHSKLTVIDLVGLTNRHIASAKQDTGGASYLGHEKFDSDYVLSRGPRFVLAHHFVSNVVPMDEPQYRATAFYPAHRNLLAHPLLNRDYRFKVVKDQRLYHFFYERRPDP